MMSSPLVLPAPAKLNLFLHIIGRREDGYHLLQTLFQFLDYGDELSFEQQGDLELICDIPELVNDDNLILKAARMLQEKTGCQKGAKINLTKRLPMGGGVGGGSSDAATALLGLNLLWELGLSIDELAELGLKLGADVPVFIRGYAAFGEGVGEKLTPVEPEEQCFLVLKPDCHVNTLSMFKHPDLTRDTPAIKVCAALDRLYQNECRNDFQSLVRKLYPEVDKSLLLLDNAGNSSMGQAMMSGSGACVFASFVSREQAEATLTELGSEIDGFVARGVNQSPLHNQIRQLTTCTKQNSLSDKRLSRNQECRNQE
ncbi:4-(cytidine 5'-diphospho)-2-C-methyl-D-erythritol kinase [Endozoicomonas sp. OPT23]|uniref:4-(cytidine 5'-diphospho)-2-C-methyl-D-erythritol kinase n=1 Tax=Endozoicomonas sp. OPT23 TaxID=2072845 RepID=UPI001E4A7DB7|nr:4-(cytidine 5'-diphospho)-2-C-methyl-D-erythritol kinase [Endozoicomonas sp. OPT23]